MQPEKLDMLFPKVLNKFKHYDEWYGRRGRKIKYDLKEVKRGEIFKTLCEPQKAHSIQTAILNAARNQKVKIQTQNHGTYILTRRK